MCSHDHTHRAERLVQDLQLVPPPVPNLLEQRLSNVFSVLIAGGTRIGVVVENRDTGAARSTHLARVLH